MELEYTKEEAAALGGVSPGGIDLCAASAWYGDGECDSFCPLADDDCASCPDAASGAEYISTSPEDCAALDIDCDPGFVAFSNDCGCGCERDVAPGCEAQDARGEGGCRASAGIFFTGRVCEHVWGCECVGADCDQNYASIEDCEEAHRECLTSCEPVACELFCEHGFEVDAAGCEVCSCAPAPTCTPVTCELFCEHGFEVDASGCEVCRCAAAPTCGRIACDLECEFGYQQDEDGCTICECAEPPPPVCGRIGCTNECEFGRVIGEDGCPTCECLPADCAPQDVQWVGGCEPVGPYHWNGSSCEFGVGCECVGEDCDAQFATEDECLNAYRACFER